MASVSIICTALWLTLSYLTPHKSSEGRSKSSIIYPHFPTSKWSPRECAELGAEFKLRRVGIRHQIAWVSPPAPLPSSPGYNSLTANLVLRESSKKVFNQPSPLSTRLWVLIVLEMANISRLFCLGQVGSQTKLRGKDFSK